MKLKHTLLIIGTLFVSSTALAFEKCNPTNEEINIHKKESHKNYDILYLNKTEKENQISYTGNSVIIAHKKNGQYDDYRCFNLISYSLSKKENSYIINDLILSSEKSYMEISHAKINSTFIENVMSNKISPESLLKESILNIDKASIFIRDNGGLTNIINNLSDNKISNNEDSYTKINIFKEGNYITIPRFFIGSKNNFAYDGKFQFEVAIKEDNTISLKESHFNYINIYGKDTIGFLGQIIEELKNKKYVEIFNGTPIENMINGSEEEFDYKYKDIKIIH